MHSVSDFLSRMLGANMGISQGLLAVLTAYVGGVVSSLTPCVYPMIPITVSVVGGTSQVHGHAHGAKWVRRSWREVWFRGMAYVAGMAVIYSFLGVAAGLTGKVFGTLTNTPGWYIGLGLVLTAAALMMMDVIHFDPAVAWAGFKRKVFGHSPPTTAASSGEVTFLGAFALGASSGFLAAPCTTPVLTAILAYIAKTQSVGMGLALMLAFSAGLGTLLILVALFAGALQVLPKSGKWMQAVKVGSGVILLAFAEYLFYQAGRAGGA